VRTATGADAATLVRFVISQGTSPTGQLDARIAKQRLLAVEAQPPTPEQLAKMRRVSRVKVLRQRLGMTQTEFAQAFHLPITTLGDWEQRRSVPDAPARALLLAIEREPKVMLRLLADKVA
jgi:putative transcriptional regulator